jgi:hypothetical protein
MCRAKVDWLRPDGLVDYKTTRDANPDFLRRSVYDHGYHVQAAWYLRGWRALFPEVEPFFLFVAQEKEPPYLTTVFDLTDNALTDGDARCRQALEIYAACKADDKWPGYADDITTIDLPPWVRTEEF